MAACARARAGGSRGHATPASAPDAYGRTGGRNGRTGGSPLVVAVEAGGLMPAPGDVELGRRIREVRKARGIGVKEFGRLIGVSRVQIFRYESGQRSAAKRLPLIAEALGVELGELWMPPGSPISRV
jgi:DNA-binding XRE family transcriptional regulator